MFLRFTKGQYDKENVMKYRKCAMIGTSVVMEYGDAIVGIARLHEETGKCVDYDVVVARDCEIGGKAVARCIKDMIGKSNKFSANPSSKRRKYYVDEVAGAALPVKAAITFSRA